MDKNQAILQLRQMVCKYAELTIDVWCDGQLVYPDEKVIVSVLETQNQSDFIGKAYCVFDSIMDFRENSVFGEQEARETYCSYYFGEIHEIIPK